MTSVNQWGPFAQNPVTIKAAKVAKECKIKNPWAAGELLIAKKGGLPCKKSA